MTNLSDKKKVHKIIKTKKKYFVPLPHEWRNGTTSYMWYRCVWSVMSKYTLFSLTIINKIETIMHLLIKLIHN